jgi:hypothetical protein
MRQQRHALSWRLVASVYFVLVTLGCGSDHAGRTSDADIPAIPSAGDPAFGRVGHVLISDRGISQDAILDQIWIGFNDREAWEIFLALHERRGNAHYIGGRLVADASQPLGFYFDPDTTQGAEFVAEGLQAGLDFLKADPTGAEETRFGAWFVPAIVEQVVPGGG